MEFSQPLNSYAVKAHSAFCRRPDISPCATLLGQGPSNATNDGDDPADFLGNFNYKRGGIALGKIKVLTTIVSATAILAIGDFEGPRPNYGVWSQTRHINIQFRDTTVPQDRKYQSKTVMWTLRLLSCYLQDQGEWAEVTWTSKFENEPVVGFGAMTYRLQGAIPSTSADGSGDGGGEEEGGNDVGMVTPATELIDGQPGAFGGAENAVVTVTNIQVKAQGASLPPFDFYTLMINLLINLGKANPDLYSTTVTAYYPAADMSLAITATSVAAASNLLNRYIIASIADLSAKLPNLVQTELLWRECMWLVRKDGRIIGRGVFHKGKIEAADVNRLMDEEDPDIVVT